MQDRKRVLLLGSTGSIGTNTIEVVRNMPDRFEIVGLSAGSQWKMLLEQAREFDPEAIALANPESKDQLEKKLGGLDIDVFYGEEGICHLVDTVEADVVVCGIIGWAGFPPSVEALARGRTLALANKETLVVGGELVHDLLRDSGGRILPVDSEQSAIFQASECANSWDEVDRVTITASGGAFRGRSWHELHDVTPEEALKHPNWDMGAKITIDSATMMNKALEVIETRWLFDISPDKIDVLIHPQSVIHGMIEFVDGSIIAQMGFPDMKVPIQHALTYPDRIKGIGETLNWRSVSKLDLWEPERGEFPALDLGYEVAREGGSSGAAFNAANEVAVELFLNGSIRFTDIVRLVELVMEEHHVSHDIDMEVLKNVDKWARKETYKCLDRL